MGDGMSLEFEVDGLPEGVKATVATTSLPALVASTNGDEEVPGSIAMSDPTSLTGDADGDPQSLIITLGDPMAGMDELSRCQQA